MRRRTLLILGGYGGAGFPMAQLLLKETDVSLILAGRSRAKAEEAAARLNADFPGGRVSTRSADATRPESLGDSLDGADLLVVCSPTTHHTAEVAHAALAAGIDYFDIHYPQRAVRALAPLAPDIAAAGRCFITQAGFHPGLPAAFVRYAAPRFTRLRRAVIGMAMSVREVGSSESVPELMEEMGEESAPVYRDGGWRKGGWKDLRRIDFGPGWGIRTCYPLQMEEMRALPQIYPLQETGVYVAGFNWFVDYLVMPLALLAAKVRKGFAARPLARLLIWGCAAFSRPPYGVVFQLEVEGEREGQPLSFRMAARHPDAYYFTAVPAIACLLQYLDGSIARPGLWLMGHLVDPSRLIADMERMGIAIQISSSAGSHARSPSSSP